MIRLYTSLIIIAIITVILYAFFILPQPDYTRTTSLIIVPQKVNIASNANMIVNDISFIAQNAADDDKERITRKADVRIKRKKNYDIIEMSVFAYTPEDIRSVEKSVMKTVYTYTNHYYVIGNDLIIRIVDTDEIHKTRFAIFVPYVVMVVVAIGLIAGVLALFHTTDMSQNISVTKKDIDGKRMFNRYRAESRMMTGEVTSPFTFRNQIILDNDIDTLASHDKTDLINENKDLIKDNVEDITKETITIKKKGKEKINKREKEKEEKDLAQIVSTTAKSATAPHNLPTTPGNLPVVDVTDLGFSKENEDVEEMDTVNEVEEEPTQEELKARLNELLDGKL